MAVVEHTLAPGTLGAPLHRHANEDEISYVLEGELTAKQGEEVDLQEFVFEVNNRPSGPCLGAPVPYELEWTVGPLEAGEYRVTHINPPTQLVETESFVVVEGSAPGGGPAPIPTTGAVGALVLAVALVLVASRVFRRGRATA